MDLTELELEFGPILLKNKPEIFIDMIPNEYDKLIRYNVSKKQSIESYDKDSDVASE